MTGEEPTTTNGVAPEASPPATEEAPLLEVELQKPEPTDAETLSPTLKETVRDQVLEVLNHLNIIKDNGG